MPYCAYYYFFLPTLRLKATYVYLQTPRGPSKSVSLATLGVHISAHSF